MQRARRRRRIKWWHESISVCNDSRWRRVRIGYDESPYWGEPVVISIESSSLVDRKVASSENRTNLWRRQSHATLTPTTICVWENMNIRCCWLADTCSCIELFIECRNRAGQQYPFDVGQISTIFFHRPVIALMNDSFHVWFRVKKPECAIDFNFRSNYINLHLLRAVWY